MDVATMMSLNPVFEGWAEGHWHANFLNHMLQTQGVYDRDTERNWTVKQ